jgi:hypothetical protein
MRSTGQPAAASTITDVTASAPQIAAALKPSKQSRSSQLDLIFD